MTKNKTYYKALPLNIRKKMRQQQEYELYRTFIREITKFDIDTQVEAESEYLMAENKLLYNDGTLIHCFGKALRTCLAGIY